MRGCLGETDVLIFVLILGVGLASLLEMPEIIRRQHGVGCSRCGADVAAGR